MRALTVEQCKKMYGKKVVEKCEECGEHPVSGVRQGIAFCVKIGGALKKICGMCFFGMVGDDIETT